MTHNAETMWRNYGAKNATSIEDLKDAGLTQDADEKCLLNQINVAAEAWPTTNISMAVNSWKAYDSEKVDGKYPLKPSFIKKMVKRCENKLGDRCIVGNNSVGLSAMRKKEDEDSDKGIYYVGQYSGDTYIQTTTVATDIHKAINYAADKLHATMAEVPKLKAMSDGYLHSPAMQNARAALKGQKKRKKK